MYHSLGNLIGRQFIPYVVKRNFSKFHKNFDKTIEYAFVSPGCEMNEFEFNTINQKHITPPIIGEIAREDFCAHFDLPYTSSMSNIKRFIETRPQLLLDTYFQYTFQNPMLLYHKKDVCMYIEYKTQHPILWDDYKYSFSHITNKTQWDQRSNISFITPHYYKHLGLFNIDHKNNNIHFQFCLPAILSEFKHHFITQDW